MVTTVGEVMTRNVAIIAPDASIREAARRMDELNIGALPVCDGARLVGILTDRDITVRATAAGHAPDATRVDSVMTEHVRWCTEDEAVDSVLERMSHDQIRRIPVVDASRNLVGIVSLGDFAADGVRGSGEALRRISDPAEPDLSGTLSQRRAEPHGVIGDHAPHTPDRDNDVIRDDVCRRLADDGIDDSEIDVEVTDGEVTLGGTVVSFDAKSQAETMTRRVAGVRGVINNLRIRKSRSRP